MSRTPRRSGVAQWAWVAFLAVGALIMSLYFFVKPLAGSGPREEAEEIERLQRRRVPPREPPARRLERHVRIQEPGRHDAAAWVGVQISQQPFYGVR